MKKPSLGLLRLQLCLAILRVGTGNAIATVFFLSGAILWLWAIPYLDAHAADQKRALSRAQQALRTTKEAVPEPSQSEKRLTEFYATLADKRDVEGHVGNFFAVARDTGIVLAQAEYKGNFDRDSKIHSYQVRLPVKGTYGAIRAFSTKSLLALPYASLDEISLKRDSIASAMLDAKMVFTLHLVDSSPATQELMR